MSAILQGAEDRQRPAGGKFSWQSRPAVDGWLAAQSMALGQDASDAGGMGRRGRLGGPTGRCDRASDRRREVADLHYDGSAPNACALLPETSALVYLSSSNAFDPRKSKQTAACARSVRVPPCRWRSEGPRGSASKGTLDEIGTRARISCPPNPARLPSVPDAATSRSTLNFRMPYPWARF